MPTSEWTLETLPTDTVQRSATLYLSDVYGARYSASAMAANALLRYLFSAAFPLFTTQSEYGARPNVFHAADVIQCTMASE